MSHYYIPKPSPWPLIITFGLFLTLLGFANWLHLNWFGPHLFFTGLLIITIVIFGWFGTVIRENQAGLYDERVDRTFRWAMGWFIFSEVSFFATFFWRVIFRAVLERTHARRRSLSYYTYLIMA